MAYTTQAQLQTRYGDRMLIGLTDRAYPATGVYDISRARDELGYKPEFDLEKGIADYLAALKRMKATA